MPFDGDEYSEYDYDRDREQQSLFEIIGFHEGSPRDDRAHELFYDFYYNDFLSLAERVQTYDQLVAYLEETYGIDFADIWDWEDFRAWYETA